MLVIWLLAKRNDMPAKPNVTAGDSSDLWIKQKAPNWGFSIW